MNISSFVCDYIKASSKYVTAFFLSISGLKILLMNAEKAAGPMETPEINQLKSFYSYC